MREAVSVGGEFKVFFEQTTGKPPYPYQSRLATADSFPQLLEIPVVLADEMTNSQGSRICWLALSNGATARTGTLTCPARCPNIVR